MFVEASKKSKKINRSFISDTHLLDIIPVHEVFQMRKPQSLGSVSAYGFAVLVEEVEGLCRELIVIDHHGKVLGGMLPSAPLSDVNDIGQKVINRPLSAQSMQFIISEASFPSF